MATRTDTELDTELSRALRDGGHRVTLPRLLVHRHVRRSPGHLTPERVHSELSVALPSLSHATIYATLELLEELGFVRRVSTPRGTTVYDPRVDPHQHLVCRSCGRVEDLDAEVEVASARRAAGKAGFRVQYAELQLSGLCRNCVGSGGGDG
jgi:Fe2+ or Zn2+ uptake regulation protein